VQGEHLLDQEEQGRMKLQYTLKTTKIIPPGGFRCCTSGGKELCNSDYHLLLTEARRHYPQETLQQHQQRIHDDTCAALVKRGIFGPLNASVPSLKEQGDVTFIPNESLLPAPHCYNPGLLLHRGRLWMCYRRHLDTGFSQIGLAELSLATFQPIGEQRILEIPKDYENEDHEDARMTLHDGEIYVSYTMWRRAVDKNNRWIHMPRIDVAVFDESFQFKRKFTPKFGANGVQPEKNWTPFSHDGKLLCCYSFDPHTVFNLLQPKRSMVCSEGIQWNHGIIRGSTPPVRLNEDEYLSIFHSRRRDIGPPGKMRYYAGAYCFSAKEPFEITRYTKLPIFAGSEKDKQWDYSLCCVFPCGLVVSGDTALISMGSNDMECAVAKVDIEELLSKMTKL